MKINYSQDGEWKMATLPSFKDLQQSPAGFGKTDEEAKEDLLSQIECPVCQGGGRVTITQTHYVDRGSKWQRSYQEPVSIECPECNGEGIQGETDGN